MAPSTQFASFNEALEDTDFDYRPNPNAIARRSISIFSRRGTETPEPKPPFIAQAAMESSKQMTERQKSWLGRRKSVCGGSSPKSAQKPAGTILNAVPPARKIRMTALEEEMATSPNEEIMSAISEKSPLDVAFSASLHNPPGHFWNRSTTSLAQRTKSEKQIDKDSRIGIWVNGVPQWDEEVRHNILQWQEEKIEEETGFTPLRPMSAGRLNALQCKPSLSVVIPADEPHANDMTVSTVVERRRSRPVASVAPASIISKFNVTPTITVNQPKDVSPIEDSITEAAEWSPVNARPTPSRASSSTSSLTERDDSSEYSKRSSATSIDAIRPVTPPKSKRRVSGLALTISSPAAGEPHKDTPDAETSLRPYPIPPPQRSAPAPPASAAPKLKVRVRQARSVTSAPGGRRSSREVRPSRSTCSLTQLDAIDQEFRSTSPYGSSLEVSETTSPTLSQAENALEARLSNMSADRAHREDDGHVLSRPNSVHRSNSVRSVMQPPDRTPTLPKRSRKREWRASGKPVNTVQITSPKSHMRRLSDSNLRQTSVSAADGTTALHVRRTASVAGVVTVEEAPEHLPKSRPAKALPTPRIFIDDGLIVVNGPVVLTEFGEVMPATAVAAASAEDVLMHILSALTSLDDLFNTALINKGMYRVFKENEMQLLRNVAFNQSAAGWEFREWSPPETHETSSSKASSQLEHTPKTYLRCHQRDMAVIEGLKKLILKQCQTFIRRETALALATPAHPHAQRFNDAFWRIWCFCKIFGCDKGREDDVTGQLDWLKGGLLANNQGCVATVNTNLEFDMGSVLLNAPDHFAKGNANGLGAQQLYDMTEIWTCLSALMQGYQGRTVQARKAGVFDGCDVAEDDIEAEEQMLEEWLYHLLTLGPAVIFEMAEFAADPSASGFAHATMNGWTKWSPPQYSGSRNTFLKEPVARLYEERVAAAAQRLQNPREQEKKEMSRKRVATLAAEIRLKRQTSTYKRSPYIDMNTERPMSVVSRRNSTTSSRSHRRAPPIQTGRYSSPAPNLPSTPHHSSAPPTSPGMWSPRKLSPLIEDRVEVFNRLSLQNFGAGIAEDTGELAIKKIVDMGFSAAQAREALRTTDMGDGIRLDRAVDLLLRQHS